ncbi:MAG: rod shape-determining protein MreD [Rhodospirillales bacterium]
MTPIPTLWSKMDTWSRQATPFGITLLLLLTGVVPLHIPGFGLVAPVLPLIALYHWALHRPELMPAAAVFVIGLLYDALTGTPIGAAAAVFVVVHGIVCGQRRFFLGKPFSIVWLGFALVALGAFAATWVLVSVYHGMAIPATALVFQALLTLGCFPPLSWGLLKWQRAFLKD